MRLTVYLTLTGIPMEKGYKKTTDAVEHITISVDPKHFEDPQMEQVVVRLASVLFDSLQGRYGIGRKDE